MFRPLSVHLFPPGPELDSMRGCVCVVIDLLRASTTITRALSVGAARVIPCADPEAALRIRESLPPGTCLLGGERGGVRIPGFDLGNSPAEYSAARVAGRAIAFTTSNGTRAVEVARRSGAARILVGCLNNRRAVADALAREDRPICLLCAGTNGRLSLDDVLAAGAIVDRMCTGGLSAFSDDTPRLCRDLWRHAVSAADGLASSLAESSGGRGLTAIGFADDVRSCAEIDTCSIVPEFDCVQAAFVLER
ncbi:MAG: 2-phosphosulfolactate phosphatase [Phycisphaerae bacterium]|nr:2-phosphosulfolactate phosphatase [Phycisphaerae bacterium]